MNMNNKTLRSSKVKANKDISITFETSSEPSTKKSPRETSNNSSLSNSQIVRAKEEKA